ncbi:hypothetical protein NESM_000701200 [Novymonas esmeraldas]|uniref:Mon2 C-terminal domain-containing protein n=1 Tax=Novymonas esmeraldas TaxID=1808958 RepID=A0AAW0EUW3_9TRYP
MASYWWPLTHFSASEPSPSTQSSLPSAPAGHSAATATTRTTAPSAKSAFGASLDSLLVESTKHRSLVVLRDAVQHTRDRHCDPASLLDTFCIACSLLAERSSSSSNSTAAAGAAARVSNYGAAPVVVGSGRMSHSNSGTLLNPMGSLAGDHAHSAATAAGDASSLPAHASGTASTTPPQQQQQQQQQPLHYRHHVTSRGLLLQSIGDLNKLIALGFLPVTQHVAQRVADLVRELAFLRPNAAKPPHHTSGLPVALRGTSTPPPRHLATPVPLPLAPPSHGPALPSGFMDSSISGAAAAPLTAAGAGAPLPMQEAAAQLVCDEPVLVRLLQLVASTTSSCPPGTPALAELYGVVLLFLCGVTPQSMLEATCEATLTHHIHTVLAALRDSGAAEASTSATSTATFTAQLQGVAFVKDICRLIVGTRARWLDLSPGRHTVPNATATATGGGGGGATAVTPATAGSLRKSMSMSSSAPPPPPHRSTAPSSMAGITGSLAADAERQRGQQPRPSLTATPMLGPLATPFTLHHDAAAWSIPDLSGAAAELLSSTTTRHSTAPTEAAPERVRLFLLRTLTLFFKDLAKDHATPTTVSAHTDSAADVRAGAAATVTAAHSPLYVQCLNDSLLSIAMWGLREMGVAVPTHSPPGLLQEVHLQQQQQQQQQRHETRACSLELFASTQQLALASLITHLHDTTNSSQVLLEAHEQLLRRLCRHRRMRSSPRWCGTDGSGIVTVVDDDDDDYAERLSQAAAALLSLWRKTLTSSSMLWELLQLRSARRGRHGEGGGGGVVGDGEVHHHTNNNNLRRRSSSNRVSRRGEGRGSPFGNRGRESSSSSSSSSGGASGRDGDGGAAEVSRRWPPSTSSHSSPLHRRLPRLVQTRNVGGAYGSGSSSSSSSSRSRSSRSRSRSGGSEDSASSSRSLAHGPALVDMPCLARLVVSVLALVSSYMESPDASAGDAPASRQRPFLLPISPPHLVSVSGGADRPQEELALEHAPLHLSATMSAAPWATAPLCLCVTTPSTAYQCITEALSCLAAFGQIFAQLVDAPRTLPSMAVSPAAASGKDDEVLPRCRTIFLALHPFLLLCEQLCLRHLRYEEDVMPVVLKAVGYWVQVSCTLQLPQQRDAHLAAVVDVLWAPDPVVHHLAGLAPPSAAGLSDAAASPAATAVLEALLALHEECTAGEPVVPGSVAAAAAAAAASGGDDRDGAVRGRGGDGSSVHRYAISMPTWGVGWWRRRRRAPPPQQQQQQQQQPARASGGSGGGDRINRTVSISSSHVTNAKGASQAHAAAASLQPSLQQHPQSSSSSAAAAAPQSSSSPVARGWRSPAVQHVVVLGVCRLQHKVAIMKTLLVIANTLGAQLEGGWTLLARGLATTEPLLHTLRRVLSWIEESTEDHAEQLEQLLCDAAHLRDAVRSLCVRSVCQLPHAQMDLFFSELVNGTAALEQPAPQSTTASQRRWRLPRHDPQGCMDQWVLLSECLCVAVMAMIPFVERHPAAAVGDTSGGDGGRPGAVSAQRQRTGALTRALRLWELEVRVCRAVTDRERVEEWGAMLLTTVAMHTRALRAADDHGDRPLVSGAFTQVETRALGLAVSAVVGHVATVAVQLCRSASRRRGAAAAASSSASSSPSATSYQAVQSATLLLTSGPFAAAPLTLVSNSMFSSSAAGPVSNAGRHGAKEVAASAAAAAGSSGGARPPLLPFVLADAAQGTSALLAALLRSTQSIALCTPMGSPARSIVDAPLPLPGSVARDPLELLLASPFVLLDSVYGEWQRQRTTAPRWGRADDGSGGAGAAVVVDDPLSSPAASPTPDEAAAVVVSGAVPQLLTDAAAAVLTDVVKIVQSYGEDIDGAAWEAILSLLQRTAMAARGQEADEALASSSDGAGTAHGDGGAVGVAVAAGATAAATTAAAATAAAGGAEVAIAGQAVESLNTAFRALESIQHNYIPHLKAEGLLRLVACVGAFAVHRVDGGAAAGDRKLHTNLSAVQLLWSIADYLATFGDAAATAAAGEEDEEAVEQAGRRVWCAGALDNDADEDGDDREGGLGDASADGGVAAGSAVRLSSMQNRQQQDKLWCSLLWQLRSGCLDDRQEVRQSALQTFFALVQTYGWRFSALCWRCVLLDVLQPLMEVTATATQLCATPPPSADAATNGNDGTTAIAAAVAAAAATRRLLRSLVRHPPQLEEVRVTLFDAGSRAFVTHYAHMQAAAALSPSSPGAADVATRVLERLLRLCGDACLVARGTSGEQAAVAAVHAVHGLLVEMPSQGLHETGVHLAWRALERLLLRGDGDGDGDGDTRGSAAPAPYAHTEAKQCTVAVVAATVAAICDSFRLQRLVEAEAAAAAAAAAAAGDAVGVGSYFAGWGGGGGGATAAAARVPEARRGVSASSSAHYFTRLLCVLQAATRCPAVLQCYYFPSKAQLTLLEGVAAVWPTLTCREARMVWGEVLLPAFPSAAQLQRFVLQDTHAAVAAVLSDDAAPAAAAAATTLIALKSAMPPGSHPGYLSAVLGAMRGLMEAHRSAIAAATATTAASVDEDRARLAFMAPTAVQVTGTLLLLHLASAAALAGPPRQGGVPYTLPALFLQDCNDLMYYALWEAALERGGAASQPPPGADASHTAAQCRRDGVAALCRVFELLLATTSTVVQHVGATAHSSSGGGGPNAAAATTTIVPAHVTAALQSLDQLVDALGEVVHYAMEQHDDVACATAAITALSAASTAEGAALAGVSRRSLSLLQRWAGAVAATPGMRSPASPSTAATPRHHHYHTRSGSGSGGARRLSPYASDAASRTQLLDVVRASMEARNTAIVRRFVDNPDDASAAALLLDTLRDLLRMAREAAGKATTTTTSPVHAVMPELLRLVACASREPTRSAVAIARELETREVLADLLALAVAEIPRQLSQQQQHQQPAAAAAAATGVGRHRAADGEDGGTAII